MSIRVKCPSCGRTLVAQDAALGSHATCPVCLAEVPLPDAAEAVQRERTERRERGPSCSRCGRDVEPMWINCPWCEEPLRGRSDRPYGRPDLDVRRDRKRTGVVMILLAAVGAIGVAILFFGAFASLANGAVEPMVYLVVAVLFLAGLTTLIVFLRTGGSPGADGFRRVVVGTLAMAGGAVAVLACLTLAFVIVVFITCSPSCH